MPQAWRSIARECCTSRAEVKARCTIRADGNLSVYVEGMGIGTGLAFDREDNLYVGDRSGTVFKISRQRQIYVFATVEPSIAAYHLAFGPGRPPVHYGSDDIQLRLYPSRVSRWRCRNITIADSAGPRDSRSMPMDRLYVAASLAGRRGVVRIDQNRSRSCSCQDPTSSDSRFCRRVPGGCYVERAVPRRREIAGKPLP